MKPRQIGMNNLPKKRDQGVCGKLIGKKFTTEAILYRHSAMPSSCAGLSASEARARELSKNNTAAPELPPPREASRTLYAPLSQNRPDERLHSVIWITTSTWHICTWEIFEKICARMAFLESAAGKSTASCFDRPRRTSLRERGRFSRFVTTAFRPPRARRHSWASVDRSSAASGR